MRFKPASDPKTIYQLTYVDGSTDAVVGVRVHERDPIVIEVGYMLAHGAGLKVKRIERDAPDEISFSVLDPQLETLDGVVTLTRTAEVWR